jgi:hypothetical protein
MSSLYYFYPNTNSTVAIMENNPNFPSGFMMIASLPFDMAEKSYPNFRFMTKQEWQIKVEEWAKSKEWAESKG